MVIGILGFAHPVVLVQDLESSIRAYEVLGCTVPPGGSHSRQQVRHLFSFRLVFFEPEDAPALMSSLVCQRLTSESMRKPECLTHRNTANEVFEII